jgi:hypothetical protein
MKVSHGRSISIALVVAAGAAAIVLLWRSPDDAVPPPVAAPGLAVAPVHAPAANGLPGAPPSSSEPTRAELSAAAAEADKPEDDYEDHPLARTMHQILASDRQLATFMHYYNRPLLDDVAKAEYHEILSDPAVVASVEHDLLYPSETKADKAGNIKRLMKIDYLREALEWKDNPMRAELIALISQMILTDNYPADMTMDMRLSLSGNKMELYEILYSVAPDQASALLLASRGTRLEALIAYIANTIEVRRRLEASASNEVRPPSREN